MVTQSARLVLNSAEVQMKLSTTQFEMECNNEQQKDKGSQVIFHGSCVLEKGLGGRDRIE
jgi:ethanolamine utilization cobalamin adenosyltransferase